jgi:hypothetical protein
VIYHNANIDAFDMKVLQLKYTFGPEIYHNDSHVTVMRAGLTRNIGARFPDMVDEIAVAFADHVPTQTVRPLDSSYRLVLTMRQNGPKSPLLSPS